MKIRIIALGHKMPMWVEHVQKEYLSRMPKEFSVELIEIKPETRHEGRTTQHILENEAKKIFQYLKKEHLLIVLDERGKLLATLDLAELIKKHNALGTHIDFIIGSADGLHASIKEKANLTLSLSAFTLPHGMARAILCEQLYRCHTLLQGHPYHRE